MPIICLVEFWLELMDAMARFQWFMTSLIFYGWWLKLLTLVKRIYLYNHLFIYDIYTWILNFVYNIIYFQKNETLWQHNTRRYHHMNINLLYLNSHYCICYSDTKRIPNFLILNMMPFFFRNILRKNLFHMNIFK